MSSRWRLARKIFGLWGFDHSQPVLDLRQCGLDSHGCRFWGHVGGAVTSLSLRRFRLNRSPVVRGDLYFTAWALPRVVLSSLSQLRAYIPPITASTTLRHAPLWVRTGKCCCCTFALAARFNTFENSQKGRKPRQTWSARYGNHEAGELEKGCRRRTEALASGNTPASKGHAIALTRWTGPGQPQPPLGPRHMNQVLRRSQRRAYSPCGDC